MMGPGISASTMGPGATVAFASVPGASQSFTPLTWTGVGLLFLVPSPRGQLPSQSKSFSPQQYPSPSCWMPHLEPAMPLDTDTQNSSEVEPS